MRLVDYSKFHVPEPQGVLLGREYAAKVLDISLEELNRLVKNGIVHSCWESLEFVELNDVNRLILVEVDKYLYAVDKQLQRANQLNQAELVQQLMQQKMFFRKLRSMGARLEWDTDFKSLQCLTEQMESFAVEKAHYLATKEALDQLEGKQHGMTGWVP